jgi:hypothetical protein
LRDIADWRIVEVQVPEGTARDWPPLTVLLARHLCRRLLDSVPDRALPEVCESLVRTFEFYTELPEQVAASTQLSLPPARRRARMTAPRERPPFKIGEE